MFQCAQLPRPGLGNHPRLERVGKPSASLRKRFLGRLDSAANSSRHSRRSITQNSHWERQGADADSKGAELWIVALRSSYRMWSLMVAGWMGS